jgi:hypothetical protein
MEDWKITIKAYLDSLSTFKELVHTDDILVVVSHTFIYAGSKPPEEESLKKFIEDYTLERYPKETFLHNELVDLTRRFFSNEKKVIPISHKEPEIDGIIMSRTFLIRRNDNSTYFATASLLGDGSEFHVKYNSQRTGIPNAVPMRAFE